MTVRWHRVLALAVMGALPGCAAATRPVGIPEPVLAGTAEPRELAVDQQVRHALERLTYGGRPEDVARVLHGGLDAWLTDQLVPERSADAGWDSVSARFPVLAMRVQELVDASPQQDVFVRRRRKELGLPDTAKYVLTGEDSARFRQMTDLGNRRVNEYLGATLTRAVVSDHQLQGLMTDFWENHFSVFRGKMPTQFTLLEYDRDVIRPRALGKFRDLLGAVAHSAAMLWYLDNYQSSADSGRITLAALRNLEKARTPAERDRIRAAAMRRRGGLNENYGRELLELHTLGVDGGYTQRDVIDVARAFTGWTLRAPREGGEFTFNAGAHDADAKHILGVVFPPGGGEDEGEAVLDMLARDPHTARFIAKKLVRHFVADSAPPALVERAAAEFRRTDGDIRQVMAVIVSSPEFYTRADVHAKVKTPFQLVASTYRVLGALPDTGARSIQLVAQLGAPLFGHLTPEGYPDVGEAWMNTGAILARINFGAAVAAGRVVGIAPARWPFDPSVRTAPLAEQVKRIDDTLLLGEMSADTHDVLMAGANPLAMASAGGAPAAGARRPTFAELVGLALGSPEFQRR